MKYKECSLTITATAVLSTPCYKLFLNHISVSQNKWIMANPRFLMCNTWPVLPSPAWACFCHAHWPALGNYPSQGKARLLVEYPVLTEVQIPVYPCKQDNDLLHVNLHSWLPVGHIPFPLSLADHPAFPQQLILLLGSITFSFFSGTHL